MGSTLGNLVTSALPTRHESRALLRLALPIVAVQVGLMLMGVVDTVMVGHLSAQALAAVAILSAATFAKQRATLHITSPAADVIVSGTTRIFSIRQAR